MQCQEKWRADGGGWRADDEGQGRTMKSNGGRRTADGEKFLLLFRYTQVEKQKSETKYFSTLVTLVTFKVTKKS